MSRKDEAHRLEKEVYEGLLRGYRDAQEDKVSNAKDALKQIRASKGW